MFPIKRLAERLVKSLIQGPKDSPAKSLIQRSLIQRISAVAVLGSLLVGSTAFAADATNRNEWRYSKPLELQGNSKYHSLFLDEDVYKSAKEDLGDLRIMDDKGRFIPYYVDSGYAQATEQQGTYKSTLVHTIKQNNDTVVDFRITPIDATKDIQGNQIALSLPAQAFLKHLEIYGSYDGNGWELLKKEHVYRTDQLEKSTVILDQVAKFSYYRIKVLDNVENLVFPELQLIYNTRETKWKEWTKTVTLPYEIKEESGGGQTLVAIRNDNRLRITKIELAASGSFTRSYTLQGMDTKEVQVDGKRELYRLDFKNVQLQNTTIIGTLPMTQPQLTITINNQDNPPINLTGMKIDYFVDKLVFEREEGRIYQLLYGNNLAGKPSYDIGSFRQQIEQENPALAKLGLQAASPGADSITPPNQAWFQTKTWFNIIIIGVSILLAVLLGIKLSRSKG
ncbi:DUF3999 family protein [Paenibacillus agricola]|uniref:DUF3999 domain-containing protein n=1 Tax=Paenibacillus agricola TaxID=2716264 RepID=A0ABX0JA27_9BACL|nr:DUF3999 family protein [Paenibacillus agricola]NHN32074.1 DUF3999 domain-containing protein [Paenibacillus agricola]